MVESVPRNERIRRQPGVDRATHEGKAREQSDTLLPGRIGNDRLHRGVMRGRQHQRRVLQVHQDHVGAARLQQAYAARHALLQALCSSSPGDIVGAKLPDHEIGPVGQDIALETGHRAGDGIADTAAIDDFDGHARAQSGELAAHDLRVGRLRAQDPEPRCRRGTDRHDPQGIAGFDPG